jgi:hypothetical protein
VTAGLDLYKWYIGEYPKEFMAQVIAWNRARGKIHNHIEDAKATKMEADSRKKR